MKKIQFGEQRDTGLDGLSSKILTLATPVITPPLTNIINLSLRFDIFPKIWKEAKVTPIHKTGDLMNSNNL